MPKELLEQMKDAVRAELDYLSHLADQLDRECVEALKALATVPGRAIATGVGTSAAVARRFAHLLCCVGVPAFFLHPADALHGSSGAISEGDVLIAMSKGGQSEEVNKLVEIAQRRGARIIALTEQPESPLGKMADYRVRVQVDPQADPFGMVATTSSLANALVADAFCTLLIPLRGHTVDKFAELHPGGAVGAKLRQKEDQA